ncbi:unnamed protein product [Rotaria socialis]|uniref:C2 domain-containing protein n=1 Tax=Rotaria socialis TaxID=392032 RepID=A0A818LL87_9BILA|nr:unnamed protein product [Rotaria socialis]CAF4273291.1 unnamed protein product [Rotaria socialis]
MLSSLKKWVQDVTVDLTPPPQSGSSRSSSSFSASSIPGSAHNNIYSTKLFNENPESRGSMSSAVYLSRPMSMESVRSSRTGIMSIPPPPSSPVELDLSHLNREEQEHIANVLRRARAVEEKPSNLLPVTVASIMSPAASITSSISSSSSSSSTTTSTASFASEQLEKNDNEIQDENEKSIKISESTLTNIYQCQTCSKEHRENSLNCFQCQEKELIKRDIANNNSFSSHQLPSIEKSLMSSPIAHNTSKDNDTKHENIVMIDSESNKQNSFTPETKSNQNHSCIENRTQDNSSITSDLLQTNTLTEIDESEFFYEEPSPYVTVIKSNKTDESTTSSYQIDEFNDEDHSDERDHVKELEETIANLSRHFPSEKIEQNSPLTLSINNIDTSAILEMEIESPSVEEVSFNLPKHTSDHPISVPIPINTRRINLSRSCGIRENLTDLLITPTSKPHQILQRTLSTNSKHMLSINRQKRNLPSVPSTTTTTTTYSNELQLRRANSESRFSLPAVPLPILIPQQNLDDESDLLEIDLNDPVGSIKRNSCSKSDSESNRNNEKSLYPITFSNDNSSKIKQLRDQTTNTPPISSLNSSRKSKKKLKQKTSSPPNITNDSINYSASSSVRKLQKSTSTEITYPFPITKLILNPSKHGVSTEFGFRITGGHSIANCMEVTACIEEINIHHRNYEILKNAVHEGDEVLELGGVSLRGKSTLFVENLMNTIQNEFEIVVRSRNTNINADLSLTIDTTLPRRHSMSTSQLPLNDPTNNSNNIVTKSKSASISSLHQKPKVMIDSSDQKQNLPPIITLPSNEKSINELSYRPRPSLLPNDPVSNGVGSNISIDQQNSNESDESDSLSQYFHSSKKQNSTISSKINPPGPHGRSQSVIPLASDNISASNRLQGFLASDSKRSSKDSTNIERKSSLGLVSLQFLKKKTKSVDLSHKKNSLLYQLRENQYAGEIELQIRHDSEREQLVVVIVRAKHLLPKDTNGFSDPFVKVYLLPGRDPENKRRIKHVARTLNPVWNHTVIYGNMHREELQYKKLEFTVWDYDRFKANDFLGQVTIDLKNPNVIDDKPHWYRLQALRSREEITNRGSSPRLNNLTSGDSATSSTLTINKVSVNIQPRTNQLK